MEGDANPVRRPLRAALHRILEALVRICLRHGISHPEFAELARRAFVEVAHREYTIPGRKQSASRVAVLTGLHRKDVGRLLAAGLPADPASSERVAYAARVVAGWRRDAGFHDGRGRPAALPFDGAMPSFSDLVKRFGGRDVPPRAVLDELNRVGATTRLQDGRIRLVADAYVPARASAESIEILGSDVSDLLHTIGHNLTAEKGEGLFQRKVAYDNVPAEAVAGIHGAVRREGQALLESLDRLMARNDRDANPRAKGTGRRRVMVGVYFYTEDVPPREEESET